MPRTVHADEVLEKQFAELLKGIVFTDETLDWVRLALRESHKDEKRFHDEAVEKSQREHRRL